MGNAHNNYRYFDLLIDTKENYWGTILNLKAKEWNRSLEPLFDKWFNYESRNPEEKIKHIILIANNRLAMTLSKSNAYFKNYDIFNSFVKEASKYEENFNKDEKQPTIDIKVIFLFK